MDDRDTLGPAADADCALVAQGFRKGACSVEEEGISRPACKATLRTNEGAVERRIEAAHLSRPENYFSIYQSGCNLFCWKCHSWEFTRRAAGEWCSVDRLVEMCRAYDKQVTLREPRERATSWHARDSCRCCGACVMYGKRGAQCPGVLSPDQVRLSPQGFGPARNIVAFTGGDLTCRPEYYAEFARRVKAETKLRVLLETNGWGLTPRNLDILQDAGVDAFWLDIKAFDERSHTWLTGRENRRILELPGEIASRGFVLEVLSLVIPGRVEADQIGGIAETVAAAGEDIPFTVLAFFPEFRMKDHRSPNLEEMLGAYRAAKSAGLKNVRLGNTGVFAWADEDLRRIAEETGEA